MVVIVCDKRVIETGRIRLLGIRQDKYIEMEGKLIIESYWLSGIILR